MMLVVQFTRPLRFQPLLLRFGFTIPFLLFFLIPKMVAKGQSSDKSGELKIYHIDAFTDKVFSGNPAAVCPLEEWLSDSLMKNIAMENNLSETAFYIKTSKGYQIRWFSPAREMNMCGHATLAAAFVIHNFEDFEEDSMQFESKGGELIVTKSEDIYTIDFPVDSVMKVEISTIHRECFGESLVEVYKGRNWGDLLFIFENEEQVRNMEPDYSKYAKLGGLGPIVTAPGQHFDFVSRVFGLTHEDPVTGSVYPTLVAYWSAKTKKKKFRAAQLSKRGGILYLELDDAKVKVSGMARLFSISTVYVK